MVWLSIILAGRKFDGFRSKIRDSKLVQVNNNLQVKYEC